jgi:hypothetical protein
MQARRSMDFFDEEMLLKQSPKQFAFLIGSRKVASAMLSRNKPFLTFDMLCTLRRREVRRGSWMRLSSTEKALYRCALWIAQVRKRIVNEMLVAQVLEIVSHLLENIQNSIVVAGEKRAKIMLNWYGKPHGVFDWAPQVKEWLHDATYVSYLGMNSQP